MIQTYYCSLRTNLVRNYLPSKTSHASEGTRENLHWEVLQIIGMSKELYKVTKLSADNRLLRETLRCVTKLTSLATSACHLLARL